jgi:hypothetical protein
MFLALEHFVTVHRPCGELTSDVGPLTPQRVQRPAHLRLRGQLRAVGHPARS